MTDLFRSIRFGDKVTIVNRFGQQRTGRATIHNVRANLWVLNMGGPHGSPGIATAENVTKVRKAPRKPTEIGNGRNLYDLAIDAEHTRLEGGEE